jgi:hypothetical protein
LEVICEQPGKHEALAHQRLAGAAEVLRAVRIAEELDHSFRSVID